MYCGDGTGRWRAVTIESHGFDQVTSTADAYLDEAAFEKVRSWQGANDEAYYASLQPPPSNAAV